MQEEDIPLLTEVHVKSLHVSKSINITSDLIAELTAQIKPQLKKQLEDDIETTVMLRFQKRMQDDLLIETEEIKKTNQNFLNNAIKENFELQSQLLDEKSSSIQEQATAELKQHINEELNISQQISHATLMQTIHDVILQAQQTSIEQIKAEVIHAVANAQQSVMDDNAIFLDKARADFATEIPKMMHANAEIIKTDLAKTLDEMQGQSMRDLQSKLNLTMPAMEQEVTKQFEENLTNLENNALESATLVLQASARLAQSDLELVINQMHSEGIDLVQKKLTEALPMMELTLINKVQESLKGLEASAIENASQISASMKSELESALMQMQAHGIAEVQAKLIGALPMLQDSLTEKLQDNLLEMEAKSVENATHVLQDKITRLHEDILTEHQNILARELALVYQDLTAQSQSELNIYLEALQLKSKQQVDKEVSEAFPTLYQGLTGDLTEKLNQELAGIANSRKQEFKQSLNSELPEVEQALTNKVLEILNVEVPKIEQKISISIKAEIEKVLNSVRLIFSN